MKKILIFLLIISFFQFSYGVNRIDQKIKILQEELAGLQPTLRGSIISLQNDRYNFSYASDGVGEFSQFYIGSLSKQMTAIMLLKTLIKNESDTGKLKAILNQKLINAFPNSALLKKIDNPWMNQITCIELLTHRSGLSDYVDALQFDLYQPIDTIHILQSISYLPTKKYGYSNTNYFLLGKLIEEVSKQSFDKLFREIIGEPLNLLNSYCPIKGNYHSIKLVNHFDGLMPNLNEIFFIDMHNALGTGNIISSSSDLMKWNKYLHETMQPELREIVFEKYCQEEEDWIHLGLTTEETQLGALRGFQGGQDSFHSFLGYLPDLKLHVVILSNNMQDFEKLMLALEKLLS